MSIDRRLSQLTENILYITYNNYLNDHKKTDDITCPIIYGPYRMDHDDFQIKWSQLIDGSKLMTTRNSERIYSKLDICS